jgi:hypothetical protein
MIAAFHRIEASCGPRLARLARANWLSPQAQGLIRWWPLSACTGNVAPEIVDGNHGSTIDISGIPRELAWRTDPAFGSVPEFGGSYQIYFPDARLPLGASPRTISLWVNYTESPPGCIRGGFYYGVTSDRYAVIIGTGDTPQWQPPGSLGISVWDTHLVGMGAHNDGIWHHVAAVLDDSAWFLYVDGQLENSKTLAEMPTDTWSCNYGFVGALNYGSYTLFWRGLVRDVRVYGRALSAAEVWTLYDPATRFALWAPRRSWLAGPTPTPPPPPPLSFLQDEAQIYVAGPESGQCQHAGAMAGEVK